MEHATERSMNSLYETVCLLLFGPETVLRTSATNVVRLLVLVLLAVLVVIRFSKIP